jgi:hypothetical protein
MGGPRRAGDRSAAPRSRLLRSSGPWPRGKPAVRYAAVTLGAGAVPLPGRRAPQKRSWQNAPGLVTAGAHAIVPAAAAGFGVVAKRTPEPSANTPASEKATAAASGPAPRGPEHRDARGGTGHAGLPGTPRHHLLDDERMPHLTNFRDQRLSAREQLLRNRGEFHDRRVCPRGRDELVQERGQVSYGPDELTTRTGGDNHPHSPKPHAPTAIGRRSETSVMTWPGFSRTITE